MLPQLLSKAAAGAGSYVLSLNSSFSTTDIDARLCAGTQPGHEEARDRDYCEPGPANLCALVKYYRLTCYLLFVFLAHTPIIGVDIWEHVR